MSKQLAYTISTTALLAILPAISQAATILSVQSDAEVTSATSNDRGNTSQVTIVVDSAVDGAATASIDGGVVVQASQNPDGTSEVRADTIRNANTELNTAIASFTQTVTNDTDADRDFSLDYELSGMSSNIFHNTDMGYFGPPNPPTFVNPFGDDPSALIFSNYTAASFQYSILVDGIEVFAARADAVESEAGRSLENVSGFIATLSDGVFGSSTLSVADLSGTLDLGIFAAGEIFTVETILKTQSYATNIFDEITNSVGSRSSDPVTVSSTGLVTSTPTTPNMSAVPLPAAGWMLLAGFGGLAAMKRRKKA